MTSAADVPLPPAALRERVSGSSDAAWFDQSGARTVNEWERALASVGSELHGFACVLDFGCGSGRALRHLSGRLAPQQRLLAADVDPEAIAWVEANIPGAHAILLDPLPPSTLPARSVDLIVSHSVFTHLPEDVQLLWLAELQRVLKPGGTLVTSLHGQKATADFLRSLAVGPGSSHLQAIQDVLSQHGFYHVLGRTAAEDSFPGYYGAAFHTITYVLLEWLKLFDLAGWFPTFALDHQDVVVLRSKGRP